jgi:hypothetical protein
MAAPLGPIWAGQWRNHGHWAADMPWDRQDTNAYPLDQSHLDLRLLPHRGGERTLMALSVCTVEDEVHAAYGWVSENAPSTSLGV